MTTSNSSVPPSGGRRQRKLKNLLIDPKFQLKYVLYLVGIALCLSVSLGTILWKTSAEVIARSESNVKHGEQIVSLGDEVLAESRKVSAVVQMNIVKDPIYKDEPDLLEAFTDEAKEQDARLDTQQRVLQAQRKSLHLEAEASREFHKILLLTLLGSLSALVVAIGFAAIVVTHKVAGPIFKMKRHLREVASGKLEVPWPLRKGDELVEFFDAFRMMVIALRERRLAELEKLKDLEALLGTELNTEQLIALEHLKSELSKGVVDKDESQ
jgi:methyl-accepting chemotaxis protein